MPKLGQHDTHTHTRSNGYSLVWHKTICFFFGFRAMKYFVEVAPELHRQCKTRYSAAVLMVEIKKK